MCNDTFCTSIDHGAGSPLLTEQMTELVKFRFRKGVVCRSKELLAQFFHVVITQRLDPVLESKPANQGFVQIIDTVCGADENNIIRQAVKLLHQSNGDAAHFSNIIAAATAHSDGINFINAENAGRAFCVVKYSADVLLCPAKSRIDKARKFQENKR